MPGTQDPSLWQAFLDSEFIKTLATGIGLAVAFGWGLHKAVCLLLRRSKPETGADRALRARLEKGIWEQVAHDIHEIRKEQTKLGERVARIEGFLEER